MRGGASESGDHIPVWTGLQPVAIRIEWASEEVRRVGGAEAIKLLHVNCEGCEWEMFADLERSGLLATIPIIQMSLHWLPEDTPLGLMRQRYCTLRTHLARTHTPAYAVPFGWERWVLQDHPSTG